MKDIFPCFSCFSLFFKKLTHTDSCRTQNLNQLEKVRYRKRASRMAVDFFK